MGFCPDRSSLRPVIAATSPSSGSISSRSDGLTLGTFLEPGGMKRHLRTNCTKLLGVTWRSPTTLKNAFSTCKTGSCEATVKAVLYCASLRSPDATIRDLLWSAGSRMNSWIDRWVFDRSASAAFATAGVKYGNCSSGEAPGRNAWIRFCDV